MSFKVNVKTGLRRLKWAAWGLVHQGFSDLRTSALVAVTDFEVNDGRLHLRGWVKSYLAEDSVFSISVKDKDGLAYSFPVEFVDSPAAKNYLGLDEDPKIGFFCVLDYLSSLDLEVYLCAEWSMGFKDTRLGVLKANSSSAGTVSVVNPYLEGQIGSVELGSLCYLGQLPNRITVPDNYHVDIVVPVFNGLELLKSLVINLSNTKIAHSVYFIDDCSTDDAVPAFLNELCEKDPRYQLVRAKENGGFVKSVNLGLSLTTGDVVLLNTDVQLPPLWLERLVAPLLLDDKVASATPFTNSGTICSFPRFLENNSLAFGLDVVEIDSIFSHFQPIYNEVPTGVGFCMACSRNALDAVGFLDSDTYGRGFGEENDWCQSAIKAGFKNVMVENLFVFHNHGATFQSDEKKALIEDHLKKLNQRFPNYNVDVARYCEVNPLKELRSFAYAQAFLKNILGSKTVYLTHDLGGGASSYLKRRIAADLAANKCAVTIEYSVFERIFHVAIQSGDKQIQFVSSTLSDALDVVCSSADKIVVNELASYPHLGRALEVITERVESYRCVLEVLIHDYLMICPSINLINSSKRYCGLPGIFCDCSKCYRNEKFYDVYEDSIVAYRAKWRRLLLDAEEVVVFSESSRRYLESAFGDIGNVVLRPHEVPSLISNKPAKKAPGDPIVIGLIGRLTEHKGSLIIKELLNEIESRDLNVSISLIGKTDDDFDIKSDHFIEFGEYRLEELPKLAVESGADIFFFPSVWPETFSYVCSEIISMGYPLATFDLGAQQEKASGYEKGLVLSLGLSPSNLCDALVSFAKDCRDLIQ